MSDADKSELFDREFEEFKSENPDWKKYLTDSTYYDILNWYEKKHGLCSDDEYSEEGYDFAGYVWENHIGKILDYEHITDKKEISLLRIYNRTINRYGINAQEWVLIEECGELLNAIAKLKRSRSTKNEIITELADVHIMVEQMAFFFGWDEFKAEKDRKLNRLQERLNKETE